MQTAPHLQPAVDGVADAIDCQGLPRIDWFAVACGITDAHAAHLQSERDAAHDD